MAQRLTAIAIAQVTKRKLFLLILSALLLVILLYTNTRNDRENSTEIALNNVKTVIFHRNPHIKPAKTVRENINFVLILLKPEVLSFCSRFKFGLIGIKIILIGNKIARERCLIFSARLLMFSLRNLFFSSRA